MDGSNSAREREPIFPFVRVEKGSPSERLVLHYMVSINMILESVTVLVPMIDERGQVWLAADGCAGLPDGSREEFELKTARINDHLAIGMAGSWGYGNQLIAHVFGEHELALHGGRVDVCKILEGQKVISPKQDYFDAKGYITETLMRWRRDFLDKREEIPDLSIVLAGRTMDGPKFCVWHCVCDWKEKEYPNGAQWQLGMEFGLPLGPIHFQRAIDVLGDRSKPPKKRIKECIRLFAKRCPDAVNRNIAWRRSSEGFHLDPPDWPGVESAKWPVGCPRGSVTKIDKGLEI